MRKVKKKCHSSQNIKKKKDIFYTLVSPNENHSILESVCISVSLNKIYLFSDDGLIKPRASHMLYKHSTTELNSQPN